MCARDSTKYVLLITAHFKILHKIHKTLFSECDDALLFRWHWHPCFCCILYTHYTHPRHLVGWLRFSFLFKCHFVVHKLIKNKAYILRKSSHQFYPFKLFMFFVYVCVCVFRTPTARNCSNKIKSFSTSFNYYFISLLIGLLFLVLMDFNFWVALPLLPLFHLDSNCL